MGIAYDKEMLLKYIEENKHPYHDGLITDDKYVNAYVIDIVYGGPEEGGWWYDTFEPIASIKVRDIHEAKAAVEYLDELYRDYYDDGISLSNSNHKGSLTIFIEPHIAKYQPEETPHYE